MQIISIAKPDSKHFHPEFCFVLTQGAGGRKHGGDFAAYYGVGKPEEVASEGTKITADAAQKLFPEIVTHPNLYRR